jgi:hypothetical protein
MQIKWLHKFHASAAIMAALLAGSATLRSQPVVTDDNALSFTLKVTGQLDLNDDNGTVTVSTVTNATLTTKKLLAILGQDSPGNWIDVQSGGSVVVMDRDGNQVADISSNVSISWGTIVVSKAKVTDATSAGSMAQSSLVTIVVDDGQGDTLTASGLATVIFSQSKLNADTGAQTLADSVKANVAGDGSVFGAGAVTSGSVSMKGKEVLP